MTTSKTSSLSPTMSRAKPGAIVRFQNNINSAVHRLTVFEQRIIYTAISRIPKDVSVNPETIYHISAADLDKLGSGAGTNVYTQMKDASYTLFDRQLTFRNIVLDEKHYESVSIRYVSMVAYNDSNATIGIRFSREILPFISALKDQLITYVQLEDLTGFRSQYSVPLYLMMMQFMHQKGKGLYVKKQGWFEITLDELRIRLDIGTKYKKYAELKRNVIDVALKQINDSKYTKFSVTVEPIKDPKSPKRYNGFRFNMRRKRNVPAEVLDISEYELGDDKPSAPEGLELSDEQARVFADKLAGKNKKTNEECKYNVSEFISALYRDKLVAHGLFTGKDTDGVADTLFLLLQDEKFADAILDPWLKKVGFKAPKAA